MGRLKARLTPLATTALALSTVAAGVVLFGGEAKANLCTFSGGLVTSCDQGTPYTDWHDTNTAIVNPTPPPTKISVLYPTDKQIKFKTGPTTGAGNIEWHWVDKNGNGTWSQYPADAKMDEWHVKVDFVPSDLTASSSPSALEYIVKINKTVPHLPWFSDATIAALVGPGSGSTLKKDIYEVGPGDTMGAFIASITTTGGPVTYSFSKLYDKLYIVDTATVPVGGGGIDSYQNIYRQVPGPLPILGAGAAFGFSRRLRSRVKASRLA